MMRKIKTLQDVKVITDSDGTTSTKGTVCTLVEVRGNKCVEKQWISGDWVFSADYEYQVEKCIYHKANNLGLSVPTLYEFSDSERKLLIEYVPGVRVSTPSSDELHLIAVLNFFDRFKDISFQGFLRLWKMDEDKIHKYRLDQLKFLLPKEQALRWIDTIYESFLKDIHYYTIPFDRILYNTILNDEILYFIDFEWTITGPYEFTLARIAVEFNMYDNLEITSRIQDMNLYHLFIIRFYLYGREPESIYRYLKKNLENNDLLTLFQIVNYEKYAGESWCIYEQR